MSALYFTTPEGAMLGNTTIQQGKILYFENHYIFTERKLVLGTPDVKVKVKVKPTKSFGTVKYC